MAQVKQEDGMSKSDTLKTCERLLLAVAQGNEDAIREHALILYADLWTIEARGPCDHEDKHKADFRDGHDLVGLAELGGTMDPVYAAEVMLRIGRRLIYSSGLDHKRRFPRDPEKTEEPSHG